jgi:hypothetical protein
MNYCALFSDKQIDKLNELDKLDKLNKLNNTYVTEGMYFAELDNVTMEIKYIDIKNHIINLETNARFEHYIFSFNKICNQFIRLIDEKLQSMPILEFIKDNPDSQWINHTIPFIDPEKEFIMTFGLFANTLVVASYKNLYYVDLPILKLTTNYMETMMDPINYISYCKTWEWKLVEIQTLNNYKHHFSNIDECFIPHNTFTINKLCSNTKHTNTIYTDIGDEKNAVKNDNEKIELIECGLPLIWCNISSTLDINDAYAITIDGTVFRFARDDRNNLIASEVFIYGIKLDNLVFIKEKLHFCIYNKKYKIVLENFFNELRKITFGLCTRFNNPITTIDIRKANLLLLHELMFIN